MSGFAGLSAASKGVAVSIPTLEMKSSRDIKNKEVLYVAYTIEVQRGEDSWRIPRRFQDFRSLHKGLSESYKVKDFPELPTRGIMRFGKSKFDPKFTLERRGLLEVFLQTAVMRFGVEDCAELDDFLEYSEHMIFFS